MIYCIYDMIKTKIFVSSRKRAMKNLTKEKCRQIMSTK